MRVEQFIKEFKPEMSEYCPIVIDVDGDIHESKDGHLQTLVLLDGNASILNDIPKDESPLLYLTAKHHCVIVDYENQIYMNELTPNQEKVLFLLENANLITHHPVKMSYKSALL